MRPRNVVLNASPLICLSKGGLSEILPQLFEHIVVPAAVVGELSAKDSASAEMGTLLRQEWLHASGEIAVGRAVLSWDLGRGESEVLSYAIARKTYWAVIDDQAARRCAASLGCKYVGTVGVIILAKKNGIVKSVRESLHRLRAAGLWLSEEFVREISESFD